MNTQNINLQNFETGKIPRVIQAKSKDLSLVEWIKSNRELIDEELRRYGAVLFRNFCVTDQEFSVVVSGLCDRPLEYMYRSTPRTQVAPNVYTATEYPPQQPIPQHNEEAYQLDWPMRLVFFCALPAEQGGETPIADTVKVTSRINSDVVENFAKKKLRYVRNYGTGVDLSWQTVFQTETREGVEEFCRKNKIEFEWKPNGCLRTSQVCQAVAEHPVTGQRLWFNQAHLFHVSSLDKKTQKAILDVYKESQLPRNCYYGDGSPIEPDILEHIRGAYQAETIAFAWQQGDTMLLDNMLVSHGRNPFKGKRRVLVGMGDPHSAVAPQPVAMAG